MFQQFFGNEKFIDQREVPSFSKKVCCLTLAKSYVRESFCAVFQKIVGNKKFMDQRVVSLFFKEGVLSRSSEKLRRGTLLCCVSEICR